MSDRIIFSADEAADIRHVLDHPHQYPAQVYMERRKVDGKSRLVQIDRPEGF